MYWFDEKVLKNQLYENSNLLKANHVENSFR